MSTQFDPEEIIAQILGPQGAARVAALPAAVRERVVRKIVPQPKPQPQAPPELRPTPYVRIPMTAQALTPRSRVPQGCGRCACNPCLCPKNC